MPICAWSKTTGKVTLHNRGQRLKQHVHVHVVMTAGGRSLDGSRWVPITADDAALQNRALADAFKKTYLRRLKTLFKQGKLTYPKEAFKRLIAKDRAGGLDR